MFWNLSKRFLPWRFLSTGLLILSCVASGPDRAGANPGVYEPGSDPGVGFNLISWWNFGTSGASIWENAVQSIHDAGFTEVSISPIRFAQTSTGASQSVGTILPTSSKGPELSHIAAGISRAKSLGMRVTVNPFVGMLNGTQFFSNSNNPSSSWRGFYNPTPGSAESITFWGDYENYLVDVAQMAEASGADSMLVGTELKTIVQNSGNNASWSSVISAVDGQFSGQLGYAANWDNFKNGNLTSTIWDNPAIDFVGVDAYFRNLVTNGQADASGAYPDPTFIAQMESAWNNQLDNDILPFAALRQGGTGLPVEFTELGYLPYNRTSVTPQNESGALDTAEQTMAFEGLLRALDGRRQDFLATHIWTWGMPGTGGNLWDMGVVPGEPNGNNLETSQWLANFIQSTTPGPANLLYSWETGLEGWQLTTFGGHPATLQQSSAAGATDGVSSLAVSQTVSSGAANHFSWNVQVSLGPDQLAALQNALVSGAGDFTLDLDITYDTGSIPQGNVSWMNASIAMNDLLGGWSQVDGLALTNGQTDETIHVSIPLSDWTSLSSGSSSIEMVLAINGDWGPGTATVYYDQISLVNTLALFAADFDQDGDVDNADLGLWELGFGTASGASKSDGDADGDGDVDGADLLSWQQQLGSVTPSSAASAVPEPGAALLMVLAGFCLAGVRKHSGAVGV